MAFNYAWQVHMEDNQRPFTPMIDRDPPTPEPIESSRRGGHKAGVRTSSSNVAGTDVSNAQESPTAPVTSRGKEKTAKDAGKSTAKDGHGASKAKGPRPSVRSIVAAETAADEKDGDNDPNASPDGTNPNEVPRGESESSVRSPPSVMTEMGYIPFVIEPDSGSIAVGASQIFKVKFAPLDVNDYQARLICG